MRAAEAQADQSVGSSQVWVIPKNGIPGDKKGLPGVMLELEACGSLAVMAHFSQGGSGKPLLRSQSRL
jgi:hypothetical protein